MIHCRVGITGLAVAVIANAVLAGEKTRAAERFLYSSQEFSNPGPFIFKHGTYMKQYRNALFSPCAFSSMEAVQPLLLSVQVGAPAAALFQKS